MPPDNKGNDGRSPLGGTGGVFRRAPATPFSPPPPFNPAPPPSAPPTAAQIDQLIGLLSRRVDEHGHPNINTLWALVKDIDLVRLNIKNFGYTIARQLQEKLLAIESDGPTRLGLSSRAAKQREVESNWFVHWCSELKIPPIYHRKIWEFCFFLQSLYDADLLKAGSRGLGFGCGEEPLPSYLANLGINVTVTDLDPETVRGMGWAETGQHSANLEKIWHSHLVDRQKFDELVSLRYVDMNKIPSDLTGYDFCWSICSLEHLGSIANGLRFIENSLNTLKPGGLAIHTTEYNFLQETETIDNWQTVIFLRRHFQSLAAVLSKKGHTVYPMDFDVGDGALDGFIDLPPFDYGAGWLNRDIWSGDGQAAHLKLAIDGFASTCFGIVVRRAG